MKTLASLVLVLALTPGAAARDGQIPLIHTGPGGRRPGGEPVSQPAPGDRAVTEALAALDRIGRTTVIHARVGTTWTAGPDGVAQAGIWIAGEFDSTVAVNDRRWEDGASVSIQVMGPDGFTGDGGTKALDRDDRCFLLTLPPAGYLRPGDYSLSLVSMPTGGTVGVTQGFVVNVPARSTAGQFSVGQPLLYRRGPFTGNDWAPAGDVRYHRQERIKLEIAVAGPVTGRTMQLLDRAGHPIAMPVAVSDHEASGITTVAGELALAPLGNGDFVLETSIARGAASEKRLVAFRIIP
jgi:hypothetical protein